MSSASLRTSPPSPLLPRLAADVPIIILRREGQEPGQHKDLHVRGVRVRRALIWLIANNPYYRDIVLDDTALSQLPVDRPCTHTSDDRYIYQLSLVVATATVLYGIGFSSVWIISRLFWPLSCAVVRMFYYVFFLLVSFIPYSISELFCFSLFV